MAPGDEQEDKPPSPSQVIAMTALLAERRADLVRFFTLRLGAADAASQVLGEIHAALVDGRLAPSGGDPLAAFYRFGSNLAADRLRVERSVSSCRQPEIGAALAVRDGPTDEPERPAEERCAQIVAALRDLPQETLQVFRLHKFEGHNNATIATMLSITEDEVEQRVRAAWLLLLTRVGA